jgi:hypothetical protein
MNIKKFIILLAICVATITIYFSLAKYSVSDITPDNYKKKLEETNASLFEAGLDNVIPENLSLYNANEYLNSDNFRGNGIKITNTKTDYGHQIEISSSKTKLNYWITFDREKYTRVWIFKQALMDPDSPPNPLIKEIINNLILNNGFILKRSEFRNGSDFIIKETDNCFIIGSFLSYDGAEPISNITFSTFSKKYFHIYFLE